MDENKITSEGSAVTKKTDLLTIVAIGIATVGMVLAILSLILGGGKNGTNGINGEKGDPGIQGAQGEPGKDGETPTIEISDDGYWVINGEKTNVKAEVKEPEITNENPQGLDFYLKDDGTYIVSIGKAKYLSKVVIPATYCGKAVTEIAPNGFSGNYPLKEIVIPDSVTSIGNYAFYNCTSLTSVVIGNGVTSIGNYAFYECSSLTSIVISDSVTSIGDWAFLGCTSLTNIEVDADNQYYKSIDGNLYSKDGKTLIRYAIGKTDINFTIPSSVTSIGDGAFSNCESLRSIVIPDGVTSIGYSAFSDCTSLTSIVIPDSVTSIGYSAFSDCTSLTSVVIPDSITSIGDYAFYNCTSLTSVVIPDSVTSIGWAAFSDCSSLISVVICDGVTSIGDLAFSDCSSLTDVYYTGSKEEWKAISIGSYNSPLTNARKHFNYVP